VRRLFEPLGHELAVEPIDLTRCDSAPARALYSAAAGIGHHRPHSATAVPRPLEIADVIGKRLLMTVLGARR